MMKVFLPKFQALSLIGALALVACGGGDNRGASAQNTAAKAEAGTEILAEKANKFAGSQVAVVARGTLAANVGPTMQVHANGQLIGSVEVRSAAYQTYHFATPALLTDGSPVEVTFVNDAVIAGADRNLYVQSINVDGKTFASDAPEVRYVIGGDEIAGQEDMLWSGTLRFNHASNRALTVRARGSLANGVAPWMNVRLNDRSIAQVSVRNTEYHDYTFHLPPGLPPESKLDLVFENDEVMGAEDRNLFVDSITVNGRPYQSTASSVTYDVGAIDGMHVLAGREDLLWNGALRFTLAPAVPSPRPGDTPPSGYTLCALEDQTCRVDGTAHVIYGTNSTWTTPRSVTGSIGCNSATFSDNVPGVPKACYTAVAPAPLVGVSITSFGAVCDGRTNNSAAIASAIASAKSRGLPVLIPVGVCAYSDLIRLDGVKLIGQGDSSVLYALDVLRSAIFVYGNGVEVRHVKLSGVKPTVRRQEWEATRITLFGATNFVIDHVSIDTAAAAGIQTAHSARHGRITNNNIKDTLSDSIHMTDKASDITVENNHIANSGDDGIAVVSYREDGGLVNQITARNNRVLNNKWGRQMSVVGGSNVLYENNYLENNQVGNACVYIAQEAPYDTLGARNVVVQRNTLKNCGGSTFGHGAVMIYSDGADTNTNITLTRNDIYQNGQIGMLIFSDLNKGIHLDSNRIQGASPALEITTPGVSVIPYTSGPVGYVQP